MIKIISITGVLLLIVQPFGGLIFAQESIPIIVLDEVPIVSPAGEQQGNIVNDEIGDLLQTTEEITDENAGAIQEGSSEVIFDHGGEDIEIVLEDTEEEYTGEQSPADEIIIKTATTGEDIQEDIDDTVLIDTGDVEILTGQSLVITEVYFAGTDERFELYNPTDTTFIGDIQVVGVKSSVLTITNISIPAHTARIFGDNMLMITDTSIIAENALGLSMTDTSPIDISLSHSGKILDTFLAPMDIVSDAKPNKASLEKLLSDKTIVVSPASHNHNNIDTFTINPGLVYDLIHENAPEACESRGSTIQIKEIFRGEDTRMPYIELFAPGSINQTITINGTQLDQEISIGIDQPAGHYHIITTQETGYRLHPYRSDNQELSFRSELGNVVVYGQDGQVLDKVDIVARETGYASYVSGNGCARHADIIDEYTPGFAREYLSYFPQGVEKIVTVIQQIVVTSGSMYCSGTTDTGSVDAMATGDFVMEFVGVNYDPPGSDTNNESITLRSLVDYPLDLSAYALRLNTRNALQYLRGVLEPQEEITLTNNFRFPNAGACIDLLYVDFVVDSHCYPLDGSASGEIENDYSDISISIDTLLYDPPGNDTNNEQIIFTVHSGSVDFIDDFYVLINGRKYNLTSFPGSHTGTFIVTANYRMPNSKDACVSLMQGDFVFDTKCYSIPISISVPDREKEQVNTQRFDYTIRITDIDYNPDGPDTNNEKITLAMSGGSSVNLGDFYIFINGTKKKLKQTLGSGETLTLIGTYGFPNTKQACVVLQYQDHIYDTYCYDPKQDEKKEIQEIDIEAESYSGISLEIVSTLPNPISKDTHKEWIKVLLHNPSTVDLSQGFSLRINDRNKEISGIISSGQEYLLTGSFTLPNTASCIGILYRDILLDTLCYPQTKEGIIYTKNQETVDALGHGELTLLSDVRLDRFDSKICVTFSDIIIKCRNIPAGKLAKRQYEELKLSRNYISMIQDYLYNNRQNIYFNTDISDYKKIYDDAKKDIGDRKFMRSYGSESIPVSDMQTRFHLQYQQPFVQQLQEQLAAQIFGSKLKKNYQKAKKRYYSRK